MESYIFRSRDEHKSQRSIFSWKKIYTFRILYYSYVVSKIKRTAVPEIISTTFNSKCRGLLFSFPVFILRFSQGIIVKQLKNSTFLILKKGSVHSLFLQRLWFSGEIIKLKKCVRNLRRYDEAC